MQLGTYLNLKDPALTTAAAAEEETKETEPEPPPEEQTEKEKKEPLPKGIIPVWRPKQYLPYITQKIPREPVPPERLPSPLTTKDWDLDVGDEESLSIGLSEGDDDFYKDEDITEILYYFLDMETRKELEYIYDAMACEMDELLSGDVTLTQHTKSPSQELRELICGPGKECKKKINY